jgi:hypothetical protein
MSADHCVFCGSTETKGGMGMRDKNLLRLSYCKEHRLHANMLWAQYQFLIQSIAEGYDLNPPEPPPG